MAKQVFTNPGRNFASGSHNLSFRSANNLPMRSVVNSLVMDPIWYTVDSVARVPELKFCK